MIRGDIFLFIDASHRALAKAVALVTSRPPSVGLPTRSATPVMMNSSMSAVTKYGSNV